MRIAPLTFALAIGFAAPVFAQEDAVRPLVNADWVKANVGKENVVVLDIRDKIKDTDLGDKPYIANAVVAPYASAGWRTEVERRSRHAAAARSDHQADRRSRHRQ